MSNAERVRHAPVVAIWCAAVLVLILTPAQPLAEAASVVGWGRDYGHLGNQVEGVVAVTGGHEYTLALRSDGTVVARGRAIVPPGLTGVTAISAKVAHSLALKSDGTVVGWGNDDHGQATVPAGLAEVVAIAAGENHSLAVKRDGTVVAWGNDDFGQATVPATLSGVIAVAGGIWHSLALKGDGTVVAWGSNNFGQAAVPPGLTDVVGIAAGWTHSLALKNDGTVVAWGNNGLAQDQVPPGLTGVVAIDATSGHSLAVKNDGTVIAWGSDQYGQVSVPAGLTGVVGVAAGGWHSVAVKSDGTIVTWGSLKSAPSDLTRIVDLGAGHGADRTIALKADGTVVGWGWDFFGEATPPSPLSGAVAVAKGLHHTLALKSDGTVVAWGNDDSGQVTVPPALSGAVAVAAGWNHSVAVKSDGTVEAWGDNYQGQTTVPDGLNGVVFVAAGANHTVAVRSDGTVVAWGDNSLGQVSVPAGLTGVVSVAAGSGHNVAVKTDGTVAAWGNNPSGQTSVPPGLSGVVAVAAGAEHSLALRSDGTVVAWGDDAYGQATAPAGLTGAIAIAGDQESSQALRADASFPLAVGVAGTGSGSVTAPGVRCWAGAPAIACSKRYAGAVELTLHAVARPGSTFGGWSGACAGTGPCTVTMDAARTVAAWFDLTPQAGTYLVTAETAGLGSGTVATVATDPDISCSLNAGQCVGSAPMGATVALTGTAAPGSVLTRWAGCSMVSDDGTTCTVGMTYARIVTATFQQDTQLLTVQTAGAGTGTVASSATDPDISCSGNAGACTGSAPYGATVTLTATPASGSIIGSWSGCWSVSPDRTACTVSMTAARAVTATFEPERYALSVVTRGGGAGTVSTSDTSPAIACTASGGTCTGTAANGATVTLSAVAAQGSRIASWSGCSGVSGDGSTCTVLMAFARSVIATFEPTTRLLTVSVAGTGTGTVATGDTDPDISCARGGGQCSGYAPNDSTVTLTASPGSGSSVQGWSGCDTVSPDKTSCTVRMIAARWPVVTFQPSTYLLTARVSGMGTGTISSSDTAPEISCTASGGQCTGSVANGATVTLTATPASGSRIAGWSGCYSVSPDAETCTVTMTAARSVTATFEPAAHRLTVRTIGTGAGTITTQDTDPDLSCARNLGQCAGTAPSGATVTLQGAPAPGSYLAAWYGCATVSPDKTTCMVPMTATKKVTVAFEQGVAP